MTARLLVELALLDDLDVTLEMQLAFSIQQPLQEKIVGFGVLSVSEASSRYAKTRLFTSGRTIIPIDEIEQRG